VALRVNTSAPARSSHCDTRGNDPVGRERESPNVSGAPPIASPPMTDAPPAVAASPAPVASATFFPLAPCTPRAANRTAVDTFLRYHHEQGLSKRLLTGEDIFVPTLLDT
jgi:hypothetical protein